MAEKLVNDGMTGMAGIDQFRNNFGVLSSELGVKLSRMMIQMKKQGIYLNSYIRKYLEK